MRCWVRSVILRRDQSVINVGSVSWLISWGAHSLSVCACMLWTLQDHHHQGQQESRTIPKYSEQFYRKLFWCFREQIMASPYFTHPHPTIPNIYYPFHSNLHPLMYFNPTNFHPNDNSIFLPNLKQLVWRNFLNTQNKQINENMKWLKDWIIVMCNISSKLPSTLFDTSNIGS